MSFNVHQTTGTGACIALGGGAGPSAGALYFRVVECNTSIAVILASGCATGSTLKTFYNESVEVGTAWTGTFFQAFNGITYTEFSFTCYEPTPAQILPPTDGANPPAAPVPVPVPSATTSPTPRSSSSSLSLLLFSSFFSLSSLSLPPPSFNLLLASSTPSFPFTWRVMLRWNAPRCL